MSVKDRKKAMSSHLKREIITLKIHPGTDLDESGICEQFDLSRTPVREVFRELDGLGYVELRENRGAYAAQLSPSKLRDFFLAAPMIYGAVLTLAARNATAAQIDELESIQSGFRDALRSGDAEERTLLNVRFHELTGTMSQNVYLLPSFRRLLIDHARIGMIFYNPRSEETTMKLKMASDQHEEIIRAIRNRDECRSAELAHLHWSLSRGQIEDFVAPNGLTGQLAAINEAEAADQRINA